MKNYKHCNTKNEGYFMSEKRIRSKERDAIIQSLKSGVTPKIGIQHIQVGRVNELSALIKDIDRIADGGVIQR